MITGKVAEILNAYELVLNVGAEQGVERGMAFVVYEEGGEVIDPDSGAPLGKVEHVKAEVVAVHVQPTMCVVEPPRVASPEKATVLSAKLAETRSTKETRWEREHEKLPVDRRHATQSVRVQPIRVGDQVREVL